MNNKSSIDILLADDDPDDSLIFKEALEELSLPITFRAVIDGQKLMHHLVQETGQLPTIVFLDLNMPRKNGFDCLEEIKGNDKLKSIPVIIFSTSYDEKNAELLYQKGAHYYIRKPVHFNELKNTLHRAITLVQQSQGENGSVNRPDKEDFFITKDKTAL